MYFTENYHTHTPRCGHAKGSERMYVESAIRAGYKVLGFSDHTPYPLPENYISTIRMKLCELDDYVQTLQDLKQEYANDIELHIGLEVEYYPSHFEDLCRFLESYPIEYKLLALHFVGEEYDDVYSGRRTSNSEILKQYVDQGIAAMQKGHFLYFAHPDLIYFTGKTADYEKEMRRLCIAAKEANLPLEINSQGIWLKRNYPNPLFWKIAGEVGNTVVFGADAHSPDKLYVAQAEEYAMELITANNLNIVTTKLLPFLPGV